MLLWFVALFCYCVVVFGGGCWLRLTMVANGVICIALWLACVCSCWYDLWYCLLLFFLLVLLVEAHRVLLCSLFVLV